MNVKGHGSDQLVGHKGETEENALMSSALPQDLLHQQGSVTVLVTVGSLLSLQLIGKQQDHVTERD